MTDYNTRYRITKAQVRRFQKPLAEHELEERPANITPRLWQAGREAAESQLGDLEEEMHTLRTRVTITDRLENKLAEFARDYIRAQREDSAESEPKALRWLCAGLE